MTLRSHDPPPLALRAHDGCSLWVRTGTCDDEIVREDYGSTRDFLAAYTPRHGDVIVDAGAHIGAVCVPLAARHPSARVLALEADRENHGMLKKNIVANGTTNVVALHAALGPQRGVAVLYRADESWAHTTDRLSAPEAPSGSEAVEVLDLSSLLDDHGVKSVALLKLNIEGAEYGVVLDGPGDIFDHVERVWLEFHSHSLHTGHELVERLSSAGFDVACRTSDRELGKGWLSASRPV